MTVILEVDLFCLSLENMIFFPITRKDGLGSGKFNVKFFWGLSDAAAFIDDEIN